MMSNALYQLYQELTAQQRNVIFDGRMANTDKTIEAVLKTVKKNLESRSLCKK